MATKTKTGGIEAVRAEFKKLVDANTFKGWGQGECQAKLKELSVEFDLSAAEFFELDRYFGASSAKGGGGFGEKTAEDASKTQGLWSAYIHGTKAVTTSITKTIRSLSAADQAKAMELIASLVKGGKVG
jgi:hypothetical protein